MARQGRQHWFPTSNTSKCIADSRKRIWYLDVSHISLLQFLGTPPSQLLLLHDTGNFNDQVLMSATSAWRYAPPWLVDVRSHHGLPLQRLTWETRKQTPTWHMLTVRCDAFSHFEQSLTNSTEAQLKLLGQSAPNYNLQDMHILGWHLSLDCFAKSRVLELFWFFQLL